ncbi:PAS domain S-box protein [Microcoleus sp. AT9_B5]
MLELWKNLFPVEPFIPHGHCYLWKPGLVSLHIASDSLIALAYYSIPITLVYFVRKRQDLPYPWIFLLFSTFIIACGTTHLMEIWTLWHPTYWLSGCLKAITALVSVVTAIALVPLIPKILALPSPAQLEAANRKLEQEIRERIKVEAALQEREQFLSNIYNSVADHLWVVEQLEDGEFQVVSMNRAVETSSGTLVEHWISKRLDELWELEIAATIRARYHDCLQQGQTISYEENLPFGEQIRCFLTTLTPLLDRDSRTRLLGVSMDITERKQAENALKESEERWQLALRGNNDGIWDWNVGTNQVFFSARWKKILGYEDCEISHHLGEWTKRVHPDDFAWVMEAIQNHLAKKTPFYEAEHRILCKDGTYKWILDRGQALWDDGGNAIRMVGSSTDITESKKAEEELRWKETLLRSMTDTSPLAFFVVDNRSDDILYFNHRFCQIWGIEHLEEQMHRSQLKNNDIIPECLPVLADVPAFAESCKPLQSEENRAVVEDEIPFRDGRTIRRFSTQIRDESDRYFGRLYLFEDITDRKQIEEQLKLADFSLERSSLALAWIDRDARILRVNQTACEQRGYSREELLSMYVWEADPNFPIEVWSQHWQQLKEQKTLWFNSQHYRKDGSIIPVEITLNYLEFNGKEYSFACARDISERYRAEEALRASQARLSGILDIADEAIISVDSSQRITLYNQGAERIFGYTSEEILGQTLDRLLPERFAASHQQHVDRFAQSAQTARKMGKRGEIVGRRKDGTEFPAEASISQLELTGEKVFTVFLRDISDRKQAETALKESEARFQAFMNHSPAAAWITDSEGRILYFSEAYSRLFNLPRDLVGNIDLYIFPAELIQEYLKNIRTVLETNQTLETIELARLADGSTGEFLVYKFPLPTSSGQVLIGGISLDITDRKKAEAALQQREQEFRALVENAPDIIMRLDRECRYLYINPTVERQSGITPAAFIGKTINELGAPEALVNLWRTTIEQVFETGREQNIEYEIPSVAGLTYYASRVVPEFDSNGTVQSVLAIARDISDRKVAEAALEKARDELEIRVKERTALLATANKELRQEISDRKQAEAALETSESRLKELLDNTAAFISSARIHPDRVWEYNYYSPNGEALFGYKGEEFAADPSLWFSRIPAEDMKAIVLPAMEDLYAGHQITIEYRFHHKNGNVRWLSNTLLAKKIEYEDVWFATGIVIDITERKQAEQALQESEQRFATLAKTAPVGIFRNNTQGYCVYGNERCLEMVGLSLEESIGEGWATALYPDDRDRVITAWYNFVQENIPYDCEFRLQRRDGSIIWVLGQAIAETNLDGNTIGYIGTITDITERKQSEQLLREYNQNLENQVQQRTVALTQINAQLEQEIEERKRSQAALQESEERYRTVITAMAEGIVLQDRDGAIRTCNASAKRILGVSRKQMMGRTSLDPAWRAVREDGSHFPGEEHPAMVTLRTGKACSNVVMGVHKPDGSFTWISINTRPIFRPHQSLPNGVVCSFADITARKQAEEALRQSEARYLAILEDQTELIGRALPDGTLTFVNEAFCRFYGMTREELIGQRYEPNVFEEDRELVARLIKTLSVDNPLVIIENRVIAKGQEVRWTQWVNRGIFDKDGQLLEFQGVGRDITDRKRAEENLRRYEKIVATTTDAIFLVDRHYTYQVVNQAYLNWHQRSREEILGHTISEILNKDLFETQIKAKLDQCLTGETLQYELWVKYSSGDEKFLSVTYAPYLETDGTISGVVASLRNLTELKRMEVALQQSESTLRAFFNSSVMMMGIVELYEDDILLLSANLATGQLLSSTPEALHNQFVSKSGVPRSLIDLWLSYYREAVKTQAPVRFEYARETPTGQKWLSACVCQISIGSNGRPRLSYIVEDISDRKQAEEALQQSESTLRSFFDSGSMLMGIVELYEDDILHLSDNLASARFFGATPEQMKNRFASEMGVPPAHRKQWIDRYREALHTQAVVRFEYPHETPTEQKWLSASVCPIGIGPNGRPRLSYIVEDISDRKRAQEALRLSEARLQHLTASIPGTLYSYGYYPDGSAKFEYISLGCRDMFEVEPEQALEDRSALLNQFSSEDEPEHQEAVARAIQNVQPLTSEWRNITPSGKQRWLRAQAQPECREDGSKVWHGVILDITDRKLSEEKLKQAEYKYRTLIEQIPGVVYISPLKATTEEAYISPQLQQLVEVPPEEWYAGFFNSWADYVHPEDRDRVWQAVGNTISTGEPLRVEYRMITRSGRTVWVRDRANLVLAANGKTQVLQGLAFDISDRKQMEQALQESNERFQLAASAVKGFIYDWDFQQNTILRTQGLFDAVGYRPEEAEAKLEWWNEHVHPEDLPNASGQLAEAFSNPTQIYYAIEYRLRHRNGHYVYLSDYGAIARDANGRAIRAVGHAIDVSDRRKAEAALQKALQAAQAASIAKSRFLSNMSHELRTPLNAILGFSQVMVRSSSLSSDHKEQLKIINHSGEHLLNLINDILSMAKIEAGQTTLNENRFDLYQLLDDLEQMLKLKAISKGLHLIFERASDLPQYVQSDENKLRQILLNLLGNSIKFTASGQVVLRAKKGRVSKKNRSLNLGAKTHLLFEVEDTGPGISPNEIETLFDPFVQTESGRKSMQGTGLGLPISQQFVEMMGGEIAASSQLGQGTIFRFDIVAIEVAEPDEKSLLITQEVIGLESNQPVYRILVVEDVEENRQLLLKILEPLGFEVREAVNGQEAIALWSTWKPHLIWMDMRMPVMDGYEATREIKALEQQSALAGENINLPANSSPTNATKIIALTASAFEEDRAKIMTAGCDDFIHKPFRESMLFDKMAQHLGVRYLYQEDLSHSLPQPATPRNLTPEDLNVMPSEWIAQFRQEVLCANDELILQLIDQIPESEASLAHTLRDLVNNFRLDILFDLIQASSNE